MKFNIWTVVYLMAGVFIGGFVAGFIIPYIPFTLTGWTLGIFTGIIQMLTVVLILGSTGKLSLWTLIIGGLLIFIGGLIGAYVADFMAFTGYIATGVVLLIQSLLLIFSGVVSPKGSVQKTSL